MNISGHTRSSEIRRRAGASGPTAPGPPRARRRLLLAGIVLLILTLLVVTVPAGATSLTVSGRSSLYYSWLHPGDSGAQPATSVGIAIPGGAQVDIVATGEVRDRGPIWTDADGNPNESPPHDVFRGLTTYSLIGAWSSSPTQLSGATALADAFFVGTSARLIAPCAVEPVYLFLGENDGVFHDNYGAYTVNLAVSATNVAPTIDALTPSTTEPVNFHDQPVGLTVGFSDPDCLDPLSVTLEWGDGLVETIDPAVSPVTLAHAFGTAGVYAVTVTVSDSHGGVSVRPYEYIVVYDPEEGFVTGGGWIDSPEGACHLAECDTTTAGKANFGFVSRYRKGASIPSGNTEFNFSAASLNFHSDSYRWLVINQSDQRAQYKGEGQINHGSAPNGEPYHFMLWATDDPGGDAFRIKIWYELTDGSEILAYDNGVDTPLGGGNIRIHR